MDEEAVREYVEQAQATIEAAPQMDEANTKAAVLREFLDLLGWEIPANTQLEYSVKAFGKTYKVDYALILEGAPVAFLEAKGVDTTLSEKHREQLKAYLKNEDVNLGILTNGEEYEFYRREVIDSKVNVNTLEKSHLRNLPYNVTTLRAFSKNAIQSDEWAKILNRIKELRDSRRTLENDKDDLATEVADLFSENVSESIASLTEYQAKEMIDRIVSEIRNEINSDSDQTGKSDTDATSGNSDEEGRINSDAVYLIRFVHDGSVRAEFEESKQSTAFVEAVDYLVKNHDLISEIEPLPYIPGRKRPIIHTTTSYEDAEMKLGKEISDGFYVETNLSSKQKRRETKRLVELYDFEVEFTGDW